MITIYDKLPIEVLACFYYEIKNNIDKKILSEAMYYELDLIEKAAKRKGVTIENLHKYRLPY
jgi:hypothetical protein